MSELDRWAPDFERAIRGIKRAEETRGLISDESNYKVDLVYNYMKKHYETFKEIRDYIESNDFRFDQVKWALAIYLRERKKKINENLLPDVVEINGVRYGKLDGESMPLSSAHGLKNK